MIHSPTKNISITIRYRLCAVLTNIGGVEFFKAYLIEFNFNMFCGASDDILRRIGVPRRIGWEPLH